MNKVIPLIALSATVLVTACSEKDPIEVVTAKANERWMAMKEGNIDKTYEFLSPSKREVTSLKAYENSKGNAVEYETIKIKDVSCPGEAPEVCQVKVYIEGTFIAKKTPVSTLFTEKWIKENGDWWFYDK